MAITKGHRHRGEGRHVQHQFYNNPPEQEKFTIPGGRHSSPATAKPIDHPDISTVPGNKSVLGEVAGTGRYGHPLMDDTESPHIFKSRTNGK